MAREQIHVGLEIGTHKIVAVVAETRGEGQPIRIRGVGETPSRGVRKGEIVDFTTASKCVHEALTDAEEKSDVEILSVWLATTGSHLDSFNSRGAVQLPEDKSEIDESDLRDVELSAKEVSIPAQNEFLHTIIQHYYVDGQQGVLDPIGMVGNRLEAEYHIIHGIGTRIKNTIRCVKDAGVEVEDVVVSALASAQVVVTPQQKDLGVIVLDIGGGVTDFIVYVDGAVRHSGVLAVGGDHITNDLSIGLRIPMGRAEKLKIEEGSCTLEAAKPGETILLKSDAGFSGCEIERHILHLIIHARMRELFELLRRRIEAVCPLELIGGGVVLTGGTSQLRGIRALAESVFEIPTRLAVAQDVSGPTSAYENPALSTPIGLVRYAQAISSELEELSFFEKLGTIFKKK